MRLPPTALLPSRYRPPYIGCTAAYLQLCSCPSIFNCQRSISVIAHNAVKRCSLKTNSWAALARFSAPEQLKLGGPG